MDGFGVLVAVVAFILGLVALNKISKLETRIAQLKIALGDMAARLDRLPAGQGTVAAEELPQVAAESVGITAAEAILAEPETSVETESAPSEPEALQELPSANWTKPEPAPSRDMEQTLASRWFVWIGGVAIAMGGLLFVKYAYDNGLVPPAVQIILGLLLGAALVAAGEFVRRKSGPIAADNYVPAALSAGGIVTAFGSVYAAFALYELISSTVAFGGLAVVALGALALSRLQGPLIAALGLIGSYGTPALIPSEHPSAWGLFPYLLVILVASFATLRGRAWWWLGLAAVAGSTGWTLLWLGSMFTAADILPIGLFAHAIGLVAFFGVNGWQILADETDDTGKIVISPTLAIGLAGLAAQALLLAGLVYQASHATSAVVLLALGVAGACFIAWRRSGLAVLAPLAALVALVVLMSWREAAFHTIAMDEAGLWSSVLGGDAAPFFRWMLGAAVALTALGIAGTRLKPQPLLWSGLAAAAPVLFTFGAWARVAAMMSDSAWAALLTGFAAALLGLAWSNRHRHGEPVHNLASGIVSGGAAVLLAFAADRLFDNIWLTLAIAVLSLFFAIIASRMLVMLQANAATALASLVTLRLFLSRELWQDDRTLPLGQHWPLYGYGVPAILFLIGSRVLKAAGYVKSAITLEGLSLGLIISLVSLEIRVLIGGGISTDEPQLLELSVHILSWLGAAYGLLYRQQLYSSFIATWGTRVLLAISAAALIGGALVVRNPVISGDVLLGGAVFNTLLLAYLAPAILLALIATRIHLIGWDQLRSAVLGLSLVLTFAYITLQTKRLFQGRLMELQSLTVAETYAYSAVWLVFALVLFGAGIRLGRQYVRYAGLGVMILVVLKVFLLDMSNLEGLYRIASFIGLGFCLIGIGWLYQRFIKPVEPVRS